MSSNQLNIDNRPDADFYNEIGYQGIGFHETLGEIIDNAISASIDDETHFDTGNPKDDFHVRVYLKKEDDFVWVTVGDDGKGMDKNIIENHLFKPGHKQKSSQGILNEHGMGLKHSLSALNGNDPKDPFEIITRTESMGQDEFWQVTGPLGAEDGDKGDYRKEWEANMQPINGSKSGTRVRVKVPYETFRSTYPSATKFKSILPGFYEHLGVMYRTFLEQSSSNILEVAWETDNDRDEYQVEPIFPVFRTDADQRESPPRDWHENEQVEFVHDGKKYTAKYNRGIVDWGATREKYKQTDFPEKNSGDSPFRIYYRNNRPTQGLDLIYRGRTLKSGLMGKIWEEDKHSRHDRFNKFIGEIILQDGEFRTVFNKTDIDTDSGIWRDFRETLNNNSKYHPRAYGSDEQEDSLRVQIKDWADGSHGTDYAVAHYHPGWGVQIDVLQVKDQTANGDIPNVIYEVKKGKAGPQDVYQCLMYWDAFKEHKSQKNQLEDVILVAKKFSTAAKQIKKWFDGRDDNHNGNYSIEFQKLSTIPGLKI